jgi:nucleoid-associated protein YgaU
MSSRIPSAGNPLVSGVDSVTEPGHEGQGGQYETEPTPPTAPPEQEVSDVLSEFTPDPQTSQLPPRLPSVAQRDVRSRLSRPGSSQIIRGGPSPNFPSTGPQGLSTHPPAVLTNASANPP